MNKKLILLLLFFSAATNFVIAQNSKIKATLTIGKTLFSGKKDGAVSFDYDGLIKKEFDYFYGSSNVFSEKTATIVKASATTKTAKTAKYLVFFTITKSKATAKVTSLLYTQSEMDLVGYAIHNYNLYDPKKDIKKVTLQTSIISQCRDLEKMITLHEKAPFSKSEDILEQWDAINDNIKNNNKSFQNTFEGREMTEGDSEPVTEPTPKVIDIAEQAKIDEITIRDLTDEERKFYIDMQADQPDKKLIDIIKEDRKQNNPIEDEKSKFGTRSGGKIPLPKIERDTTKPDLNLKYRELSFEEKQENDKIAKMYNKSPIVFFQDNLEDSYMIYLNNCNCLTTIYKLTEQERFALDSRAKYWTMSSQMLFDNLKNKKDYYIKLQVKFIKEAKKKQPKNDLEKFVEKFNPGLTNVKNNVTNANGFTSMEDVFISHKPNCDNFVVIGGSITYAASTNADNEILTVNTSTKAQINVTGNNVAMAKIDYIDKVKVKIGGSGENKDAYANTNEPIQLFFKYTDDGYYNVKFSNLSALVSGMELSLDGPEGDVQPYMKDFSTEIVVNGNDFKCNKIDRVVTISGSIESDGSPEDVKNAGAKSKDKITEELANASAGLADIAKKMGDELGIKGTAKLTWNLTLQRVSHAVGKIKDVELNTKGETIKDNTLNNAPKTVKRKK